MNANHQIVKLTGFLYSSTTHPFRKNDLKVLRDITYKYVPSGNAVLADLFSEGIRTQRFQLNRQIYQPGDFLTMVLFQCAQSFTQRVVFQLLTLSAVLYVLLYLVFDFSSLSNSIASNSSNHSSVAVNVVEESNETLSPSVSSNLKPEKDVSSEDDAVEVVWTEWHEFQEVVKSLFSESQNLFCETIMNAANEFLLTETNSSRLLRIHITIEVSCLDVFLMSGWGTGNYLHTIMTLRLAVHYMSVARVKLNITCTDTDEVKWNLILPWYTGVWYSPNYFDSMNPLQVPTFEELQGPLDTSLSYLPPISEDVLCGQSYDYPMGMMYNEIKYVARRMAVALIGVSLVGTDHLLSTKINNFIDQYIYYHGDDNFESNSTKPICASFSGKSTKKICWINGTCANSLT
jgi:hypothetical protein